MWTNGFGCVCARERNKRSSKRAWKTPRALHLDVSVFFLWVNWGRANIFLYILLFYNEFVIIISNSRRFFPHSHFLHCMFPHIFRFHISFSVTTGERERELMATDEMENARAIPISKKREEVYAVRCKHTNRKEKCNGNILRSKGERRWGKRGKNSVKDIISVFVHKSRQDIKVNDVTLNSAARTKKSAHKEWTQSLL